MMRALPVLLSKLLSCTEFHFVCFEAAAAAASSGSSPSPLLFWPRLPLLPWPLLAALEASAQPLFPNSPARQDAASATAPASFYGTPRC
jgi:hypothetical protein